MNCNHVLETELFQQCSNPVLLNNAVAWRLSSFLQDVSTKKEQIYFMILSLFAMTTNRLSQRKMEAKRKKIEYRRQKDKIIVEKFQLSLKNRTSVLQHLNVNEGDISWEYRMVITTSEQKLVFIPYKQKQRILEKTWQRMTNKKKVYMHQSRLRERREKEMWHQVPLKHH